MQTRLPVLQGHAFGRTFDNTLVCNSQSINVIPKVECQCVCLVQLICAMHNNITNQRVVLTEEKRNKNKPHTFSQCIFRPPETNNHSITCYCSVHTQQHHTPQYPHYWTHFCADH